MVTEDGRIEVWDLKRSNLEPKLVHWDQTTDEQDIKDPKTVLTWSKKSPVLVTGNSKGVVDVYRTFGLEHVQVTKEQQWQRLLKNIVKDDFSANQKKKKGEGDEDLED